MYIYIYLYICRSPFSSVKVYSHTMSICASSARAEPFCEKPGHLPPSPRPCSTQGSSWGYLKSQFSIDLVNFWRQMPTKWLQERAKGSKNEHGMPPHRGLRGLHMVSISLLLSGQEWIYTNVYAPSIRALPGTAFPKSASLMHDSHVPPLRPSSKNLIAR